MAEKIVEKNKDLTDDEICRMLKTVADHFYEEDRMTREMNLRRYRRLKLYWSNFSQIYWSEKARDYRVYTRDTQSSDAYQGYYDRPVNVFRAFLETIIAALSIQIPAISAAPDDADNPLDISTAKASKKIAEQIYKHNDVVLLWLHMLYIYCTEGMIACYTYSDEDEKYGTYSVNKYEDEEIQAYVCPQCGAKLPDEMIDEYDPGSEIVNNEESENNNETKNDILCPECEAKLNPDMQKSPLKIPRLVGTTQKPKSRTCLEMYGGLYIKVSNTAKCIKDTGYLIWLYETHYSNAMEEYPNLKEHLPEGGWTNIGADDPYEQQARLNPQYCGDFPLENVTIKNCWLRPASFNILVDDEYKKLKRKFPQGAKLVMVNDIPVEYASECLDDHWTLTKNPLSDFITFDPLGELLTNIQDITNDIISLTLQTMEHGIAQTWADPAVVNFPALRQMEAQPGTVVPTKPVAGSKNISDAFYQSNLASLSPEVMAFYKIIQELGQFVSGALPSIFGGSQNSGSSRTAAEYAMSKGMALQRQNTPWRMFTIFWKDIFAKAIPMYMKNLKEDERIVEKDERGNYINVFIRKAELDGKIGQIELEPDEKLPVTDEQKADIIMSLFQINNEELTSALLDPDNLPYIANVVKIPEFKLPGQDDREKQYEEILELVNSVPIPPDQEALQQGLEAAKNGQIVDTSQYQEQPSVPIDPDVDNHQIEASICKSWLVSAAGRLCKKENPEGYKNVLLHMKAHMQIVNQQMAAATMHEDQLRLAGAKNKQKTQDVSPGQPPSAKPPEKPMTGENDNGRSLIS